MKKFKDFSNDEEAIFRVLTSLKMTVIPIASFLLMIILLWIYLRMNAVFFKANETFKMDGFEEVFFLAISNNFLDYIPFILIFILFINITAIYMSDLLLRPFRIIGSYCEQRPNDKNCSYDPDFFTDLRLLSQFSEFFFTHIESAEKNKVLNQVIIPKKYTSIHRPVFEFSFFFNFFFYILVNMMIVSLGLYWFANNINDNIIDLAGKTLRYSNEVNTFLTGQKVVLDQIVAIDIGITWIFYLLLTSHLYTRVSIPAFAIFSTMRSFLKGNHTQKVHVIGQNHLRLQTRKINKYLDWVKRNFIRNKLIDE